MLEAQEEYIKRLRKECHFEIIEIDVRRLAKLSLQERKQREGLDLIARIEKNDFVILLDEQGKKLNSLEFSRFIKSKMELGRSVLTFGIGGSDGWGKETIARADLLLSLSDLTFTAELSRILLLEQIYRATTIQRGSPYHK